MKVYDHPWPRIFFAAVWLDRLVAVAAIAIVGALLLGGFDSPKAQPRWYVAKTHHLDLAACKKKYPPEQVGGFCDWYGGADEPEPCLPGYHADRQTACYGTATETGIVTVRIVCHRDSDRGAREPCGLECAR